MLLLLGGQLPLAAAATMPLLVGSAAASAHYGGIRPASMAHAMLVGGAAAYPNYLSASRALACATGSCAPIMNSAPSQGSALTVAGKSNGGSYAPGESLSLSGVGGGQYDLYVLYATANGAELARANGGTLTVTAPSSSTLYLMGMRASGYSTVTFEVIQLMRAPPPPPLPPSTGECQGWCHTNPTPWLGAGGKCSWFSGACSACPACYPAPSPSPPPPFASIPFVLSSVPSPPPSPPPTKAPALSASLSSTCVVCTLPTACGRAERGSERALTSLPPLSLCCAACCCLIPWCMHTMDSAPLTIMFAPAASDARWPR